jgi:hypothetical protein
MNFFGRSNKLQKIVPCLVLAAIIGACSSDRPTTESERQADNAGVVIAGHLSRDVAPEGEPIRFWITVENRSGAALQNVRLAHMDTPGFKSVTECWNRSALNTACGVLPGTGPSCSAPEQLPNPRNDEFLLCQYLRAGESLSVWGDLRANDPSLPANRLYAVVSWNAVPNSPSTSNEVVQSSRIVSLGIAEVVSPNFHWLTWLAKPEVTIPAALAFLGFFLASRGRKAEERSNVFTAMLSSVHDAAMHYHMPMASMLSAAINQIDKVCSPVAEARKRNESIPPAFIETARRGFYYLTMFHWWQKRVFQKVGAYQLKSRIGERLLLFLANQHRHALYPLSTETALRRLDVILGKIDAKHTLDDFLKALDSGQAELRAAWDEFFAWVGTPNCEKDLACLDAFATIMVYEVNSLHLLWYGGPPFMALSNRAREATIEVGRDDEYFQRQVRDYLDSATASQNL